MFLLEKRFVENKNFQQGFRNVFPTAQISFHRPLFQSRSSRVLSRGQNKNQIFCLWKEFNKFSLVSKRLETKLTQWTSSQKRRRTVNKKQHKNLINRIYSVRCLQVRRNVSSTFCLFLISRQDITQRPCRWITDKKAAIWNRYRKMEKIILR